MYNGTKMLQVGINKSILKEYSVKNDSRVVYLKNGNEFQLYLSNPTSDRISAEIYLNGKKLNNSIVLRPGEKAWIERYLDKSKKFKFETYEVDGDVATQKLIDASKNGEIVVKFYREIICNSSYKPRSVSYTAASYDPMISINDSLAGISINTAHLDKLTSSVSSGIIADGISLSSSACAENGISSYTSCLKGSADTTICDNATALHEDTIETGRIEAGGYSSQQLKEVDGDFMTYAFNIETIKILPESQKIVSPNDLQKCYCPECGHRLKNTYKFCPYCGTPIEE